MRRLICVIGLLLLLPICVASAEGAQLQITGPEKIYNRDFISLHLDVAPEQVTMVSFLLTYDTENMAFVGVDLPEDKSWDCKPSVEGFTFTAQSQSTGSVASLEFHLRETTEGTLLWVELKDVILVADGKEYKLGTIRWEQRVERPLSGDNCLSSLKISDAAISPSFVPTQQNYTATVSYHVASVDVTAIARDPNAHVAIDSPALTPDGVTNVTVTVTAEDGSQRVYTIAVTRQDDPNRPLSSDCTLSDIVVTDFRLSPVFDSKVTEYVLWLPYEVTSVEVSAVARDDRATVQVEGNKGLKAGKDNPIRITCSAEDGTQKVYTIIAKRAEAYAPETTAPESTPVTSVETQAQIPAQTEPTSGEEVEVPGWAYIVTAVAAVTGAAAVGILVSERKK